MIPVLNEMKHLPHLLESIQSQTYPKECLEVILIDGGSTDGSLEWMRSAVDNAPFRLVVVDNPRRYQSPGLNLGLRLASGELIVRMDAHAVYDRGYVAAAVAVLTARPEVVNVGGTQVAVGSDRFSRSAALAMNSPFGVGGANFRYAKSEQRSDTVFLGAWRKADLLRVGGWSDEWVINEDGELNLRLRRAYPQSHLLVTPTMKVHYHPRSSVNTLARQYYRYGLWRQKTFKHYPEALRISHAAPVLLVLGLALSISGWLLLGYWWILLVPVTYVIAVLAVGQALANQDGETALGPLTGVCLGTMHMSWGVGAFAGFWRYGLPFGALRDLGRRLMER